LTMAAPMPRLPPVTSALLFSSRWFMLSSFSPRQLRFAKV
jgi:hypothetical protein